MVLFYRDDGIPPIDDLIQVLPKCKIEIKIHKIEYKYILSSKFQRKF
jgi:hypothetical protein